MDHEGILQLFRERPQLFLQLAGSQLAHFDAIGGAGVRFEDSVFSDVVATEYRADAVISATGPDGARERAAVFEVQLRRDADKAYSWPVYVSSARYSLRCPVTLFVLALDRAVARWCAKPIHTGHDGFVLQPVVIGPDSIPAVTDAGEARAQPELAVLSVAAHGREPKAEHIALAALGAVSKLDSDRGNLYTDLVYSFLGEAAQPALELLMQEGNYEYQSDFAKRYVAQGRDEGLKDGLAQGRGQGLVLALEMKGFAVSESLRSHILSCIDAARLDDWYRRAKTATSLADIFEPALLS